MKITLLTAHLSDAAGGLSPAISGIVNALVRRGLGKTSIVGVRDALAPDAWRRWGRNVYPHREYGPRSFNFTPGIERTLAAIDPHVVDSQGVWIYQSLVTLGHHRRTGRPYVVTPHGTLDPWALRRSRWKKRLVAHWFADEHLRKAACLRALNEDEACAFRAYGLRNPIAIVPNGVDLPDRSSSPEAKSTTLLYLGRIDPKKGIEALLCAWAIAAPSAVGWRLQVTGWGDPAYVAAVVRLADELALGHSVVFTGALFGEKKAEALRNAAAFVLPSYSEGLPMAILEAWAYGLPVVMTRECNLPEGFASGAAVQIETKPEKLAVSLTSFMALSAERRRAMGKAGRRLVEERFTWDHVAAEIHEVYTWVLGGGTPPASVMTD